MSSTNTRNAILWLVIALVATSYARGHEVDGVFGVAEADTPVSIAIWIPLVDDEAVEGLQWFNNDGTVAFPTVRAIAGTVERPDDLAFAVVVGEDVVGGSSSWSTFGFVRPIASTADGIYIVFGVPLGGTLLRKGEGGGPGIGYRPGDGLIRCWISTDTETWDALAPEFQMAVVPTIASNKSSDVLILERAHPVSNSETGGLNELENLLTNRMIVAPNPFNPTTEIEYSIERGGHVALDIFDVRGRIVRRLVNANRSAGVYSAVWNGRDDLGRTLSSGSYVAQMRSGSVRIVQRLTLIK